MNIPFLKYNYGGMVTPQSSQGIFDFLPVPRFASGGMGHGSADGPGVGLGGNTGGTSGIGAGLQSGPKGQNSGQLSSSAPEGSGNSITGAVKGFLDSFSTPLGPEFFGPQGIAKLSSPGQQGGVGGNFLQQQALPGIAGLLPGAAGAQSQGNSSYDAERLARITGITVPQAQAYLDSTYGKR